MHGRLLSLIICITICLSVLCPQALAVSQPESNQTNTSISTVIGDVNGDNAVHASDYLLIKKYISGGIKDFPVSNGFWAADVNDDGALDVLDLMYIKKYILHIINTFPKNSNSDNFIKVSEKNLVKGNTPIILKGVCFGNKVWSNPSTPPETHHSEVDYTRVKEMNMNAIRFYMNYNLFEDDSNPYSYKQSGWDWLDKNISWAKKNGIYLILNMHCPQGGYQSLADGMELWNVRDNQLRLIALWKAIAEKYKDEPVIAGFDILNEPVCPKSIDQWQTLANEIVKSIRTVDKNHVIIVERMNAIKGIGTTYGDTNFFLVDDSNIMYTFHFYSPFEYSHQLTSWTSQKDSDGGKYPDLNTITVPKDSTWATGTFSNPSLPLGDSDWAYYEGQKFEVTDPLIIVGKPVISSDLNSGVSYFDDFVIKEYDEAGNFIRNVYDETNINSKDGWSYWSQDGDGILDLSYNDGHKDSSCLKISSVKSYANASCNKMRFKVKTGYYYSISGWMKGKGVTSNSCKLRIDFEKSPSGLPAMVRDKAYLENELKQFFAWGEENNVPLFVGEFGLYKECFKNDKGGVNWVSDMLDILDKYKVNYTYHDYHEEAFGLYLNSDLPNDAYANTDLINLFKSRK